MGYNAAVLEIFPYLAACLVGAVIGSFLNVCIYRLPRHGSVVWPSSRCPSCGAPIALYDNLPIVSYLWLGGRCRACRARISPRYPVIELANAVGYGAMVWRFGVGWPAVAYALLFSGLLVVTCIDLSHRIVPDVITLPGIGLGVIGSLTVLPIGPWDSILGVALGGGILWGLAWVSPYLFGKEGMGGGDIKLLAMIGSFLGWKPTLLALVVGALAGSILGLALIAGKVLRRDQYIPFGPFLALGAVLALFFHQEVFAWYAGLLGDP
jgi:leader peptidase (prepilin peptidase)/N-methyltransferase